MKIQGKKIVPCEFCIYTQVLMYTKSSTVVKILSKLNYMVNIIIGIMSAGKK